MSGFNRDIIQYIEKYSKDGVRLKSKDSGEVLMIDAEISGTLKWKNDDSSLFFKIGKDKVNIALGKLRSILMPQGYYPFISKHDLNNHLKTPEQLSVIQFQTQYDILKFQDVQATNPRVTLDDIVGKIKYFDDAYGIEIYGASDNWILVRFKSLPDDISILAKEIIAFTPDTLPYVNRGMTRFYKTTEDQIMFLCDIIRYHKFVHFLWLENDT